MPKLNQEQLDAIERGDSIAILWSIYDVLSVSEDEEGNETITKEEAREILESVFYDHDASLGITWDTLTSAVEDFKREDDDE